MPLGSQTVVLGRAPRPSPGTGLSIDASKSNSGAEGEVGERGAMVTSGSGAGSFAFVFVFVFVNELLLKGFDRLSACVGANGFTIVDLLNPSEEAMDLSEEAIEAVLDFIRFVLFSFSW
jgi:tryptophan synthase alpha subunit